jgi:hypothetical protein
VSSFGPRHQAAVDRGTQTWVELLKGKAIVRAQGPAVLDRFAAPQPDFACFVLATIFTLRPPAAEDIFLIIEIAESSLEFDRTVKKALYAILKIHEYWIADSRIIDCWRTPIQTRTLTGHSGSFPAAILWRPFYYPTAASTSMSSYLEIVVSNLQLCCLLRGH